MLEEDHKEASKEYFSILEKLQKYVVNIIKQINEYCLELEEIKKGLSIAPAEMIINPPTFQEDIPNSSAEVLINFIETKVNTPTVNFSGDDLFRYKLKNDYFKYLKKAIPDAAKKTKLARLKAQAAKNSEEQRGLSSSLRNDKNFQKQMSKFNFCPYCETQFNTETLTDKIHMDHIYPVSKGGHSVIENLVFIW